MHIHGGSTRVVLPQGQARPRLDTQASPQGPLTGLKFPRRVWSLGLLGVFDLELSVPMFLFTPLEAGESELVTLHGVRTCLL